MISSKTPPLRSSTSLALAVFVWLLGLPISIVANDPPVITDPAVTPTSLSHLGGTVTVTAQVTDDSNALNIVVVDGSGPFFFSTAMTQGGSTPDDWFAEIELPPNFTSDPINWDLYIVARDLEDVETSVFAGSIEIAGEPPFDEPPSVFDPSVVPPDLPSTGGTVQLAVSAWDLRGITEAYAVVTGPGNTTTHVVLEPVGPDRFEGVFNAPANPGTSAIQYSVEMVALDDIGQPGTVDGGLITVAAAASGTGLLKVTPNRLNFGRVKVGNRAQRVVVLHNHGRRGTGSVSGIIAAPGAPFFLAGGGSIPFTLKPGETKIYVVEFRPATPGEATANIAITRTDGRQPNLSVHLTGRGAARN